MNQFKTIPDRQTETKKIIERELGKLKNEAYNPITSKTLISIAPLLDIEPLTPFIKALSLAEQRISASVSTKRDLRSTLKFVTSAALQLRYSELPVNTIGRKHIKQLLSHIDICNGESPHRYNKISSYLMMIYKELIELEVVEVNPVRDLSKKKSIQRIRKLPSNENRQIINEYLQKNQCRFWLFMQIFFHSGARLTEMMNVKRSQVNLNEQYFIITIKKGRVYKEVVRPIKNVALQYWQKAIEGAAENDFIFSKGLLPGSSAIQSYQITKRWNRHIKTKLGIKEDFYSLKHLNLDETAAILGINDASSMASHTSTTLTTKHYALGEKQRQNERLKSIRNEFA
jgi:site-specific recombinase XerC